MEKVFIEAFFVQHEELLNIFRRLDERSAEV